MINFSANYKNILIFNYYYYLSEQSQNESKSKLVQILNYCTVVLGMHTKCKQCTTTKYFL